MVRRNRLTGYLGKVNRNYLDRVIYPRLGAARREIIVGPKFGVDNAVVRVGGGRVLVATTDPLSFIPSLRPSESAWLSVNLLASDLTTCSCAPQYGIFDFNLPPQMGNHQFAEYWKAFHAECKELGLAIVGGHTGKYQGCGYSIIGGGVMYTVCREDRYLTSEMAGSGDDVILTKGAAVETTAILTRAFPRKIKRVLGSRLFEKARRYLFKVSTVRDALTAASVGIHQNGVTAMHDATEGGVIAAVLELSNASGLGVEIDLDMIPISEETREICKFFRINPLTSLSEGTLIIASRPNKTGRVLRQLKSKGISSHVIGRLTKTRSARATTQGGRVRLTYPSFDPYWRAYRKGTTKRWQ
ncbi:MAG: AIR synthase family protein [Candidatus Bathyarchaeia archaeon]|jgi:hydrogenase maturation factor